MARHTIGDSLLGKLLICRSACGPPVPPLQPRLAAPIRTPSELRPQDAGMFKKLDEKTFVAGQIAPADLAEARTTGIPLVINNRPDGEAPGHTGGREIQRSAERRVGKES